MDKDFKELVDSLVDDMAAKQDRLRSGQADLAREQLCLILSKLDALADIEVPAALAERTVSHVRRHVQAAAPNHVLLEQARARLARGPERESRWTWVLGNLRDLIATAAVLILVFLVSRPGLQQARHTALRYQCASNMQSVGRGVGAYAASYDGMLPYVEAGPQVKPWQPGPCEESRGGNTRSMYLLVKQDFIEPRVLVCPGREGPRNPSLSDQQLYTRQDLPRGFPLGFSVRIVRAGDRLDGAMGDLLLSDRNPLFDNAQLTREPVLDISTISRGMLEMNSVNHRMRGQHVLRRDLGVEFVRSRMLPVTNDDIFTIRGARQYDGTQLPGPGDEFLP